MPSNVEYTEQANALAKELGVEIVTEGLNNSDLGKLVKKLTTDKAEADAPPPAAKAPAVKLPAYSMAKGKALTTLSGIKADGDEITVAMLPGGKATLDKFVRLGHIVKG